MSSERTGPVITETFGQYNQVDSDGTRQIIYSVADTLVVAQDPSAVTDTATVIVPNDRHLRIFADELIIKGCITSAPGAKIEVYARTITGVPFGNEKGSIVVDGAPGDGPPSAPPRPAKGDNGADAECHNFSADKPAGNGNSRALTVAKGAKGKPGSGAGNISIVAKSINALVLSANGGPGAAGQAGQDGADGGDGGRGIINITTAYKGQSAAEIHYPAGSGGNGSDGGFGGDGGDGGAGGAITLITIEPPQDLRVFARGGDPGEPGKNGAGGSGGSHGALLENHTFSDPTPIDYDPYKRFDIGSPPHDGAPGSSPSRPSNRGQQGPATSPKISRVADPSALYDPFADPTFMSMVVQRIKMELLAVGVSTFPQSKAWELLTFYSALLEPARTINPTTGSQLQLQGHAAVMAATIARNNLKLDFFGNPSDFAPYENLDNILAVLSERQSSFASLEAIYNETRDAYNESSNDLIDLARAYRSLKAQLAVTAERLASERASATKLYASLDEQSKDIDDLEAQLKSEAANLEAAVNAAFSVPWDRLKSGLEMIAFTSETPMAPVVAGAQGLSVLSGIQSTLTDDDGKPIQKSAIIATVETFESDVLSNATTLCADNAGELSINPDLIKIVAKANSVDAELEKLSSISAVAEYRQTLRKLLDAIDQRNTTVFQYNASLQAIAMLMGQATQYQMEADANVQTASRRDPMLSSHLSILAALYQAERNALIEYVYLAQRAYYFGTLQPIDVFAPNEGTTGLPLSTITDLHAAAIDEKINTIKQQYDEFVNEQNNNATYSVFPLDGRAEHGFALSLTSKDVERLRSLPVSDQRRLRFTLGPTPAKAGVPAPEYTLEEFNDLRSIRLTGVRVHLDGATHPDNIVSVLLQHGEDDVIVGADRSELKFKHGYLPPPLKFKYQANLPLSDPKWVALDEALKPVGAFSGIGPFTTWTLIIDDKDIGLSNLSAITLFFRGQAI